MGRIKVGIAVAGVVVTLLGVVAVITMQGGGGSNPAVSAAGQEPAATTAAGAPVVTTGDPTNVPGTQAPTTKASSPTPTTTKVPNAKAAPPVALPAQPTAQDIQKVVEGITSQVVAGSTSATTKPLTKQEVEAQLRELLKQFGIPL